MQVPTVEGICAGGTQQRHCRLTQAHEITHARSPDKFSQPSKSRTVMLANLSEMTAPSNLPPRLAVPIAATKDAAKAPVTTVGIDALENIATLVSEGLNRK